MGVVYLAEDKHLKRQVALKVLYEHLYRETAFVERFREEARSVSTLHHPHIVCVHGLEQNNGVVAIDMEYVDGHSLDTVSGTNQMTPHIAVSIARDVLSGLVACHELGVVHRDIKPSNILLHHDGTAKLTDFGLATAYASHLEATVRGNTSSGFYMGTPRYMPVEAWEGGDPKPMWDVYSFGIVLYELLSGDAAFAGENPMAIMKKHLTEPLPLIQGVAAGISDELADLVDALVREPTDSLLTSAEALRVLQETPEYGDLQDSNVVTTITVTPLQRSMRRARQIRLPRQHHLRGGGVAAVLLVLVLVGIIAGRGPETDVRDFEETRFLNMHRMDGSAGEERWMAEPGIEPGELLLTGYSETGLMRLRARPLQSGLWDLAGGWAETVSPQAGSFQYGAIDGRLHWPANGNDVYADMERSRERDGEIEPIKMLGKRVDAPQGLSEFLRGLEAQESIQSLLYNELLNQTRFPWAVELEAMLPAVRRARYDVPYGKDDIAVDGKLEEPLWTREYFYPDGGTLGNLPPGVAEVRASMRVRWQEEGVVLAADVATSDPSLRFELGLLPGFEVSLRDSGRMVLECSQGGETRFQYYEAGARRPYTFHWPVAIHKADESTMIEMQIPAALLKESARPIAGKRWRINARWTRAGSGGLREVVAQWGGGEFTSLEHGALFVFQRANE